MHIEIKGQPARVTHQSGTRHLRAGGSYKTKPLREWEAKLMKELKGRQPKEPMTGPVCLFVHFIFKPSKASDRGDWKTTRPDTDNMIKTLKDVLTKMRFWQDDSQVSLELCLKRWTTKGEEPRIEIDAEELENKPCRAITQVQIQTENRTVTLPSPSLTEEGLKAIQ